MAAVAEDRLVTTACSALMGALAFGLATILAAVFLANAHQEDTGRLLVKAVGFAMRNPAQAWPVELKASALIAMAAALIVGWLFAWLFWDHSWWLRPRRLDDQASADGLTRLSAGKGQTRLFGGRYGGRIFWASMEDRGLVVGPPGTGKTAFLLNQILRATRSGLSLAVVDYKPELYRLLSPALQAAGYQVLRVNPCRLDKHAHHWNPLAETDNPTELAEVVAALLPINSPGDAPFVAAQRDWLLMAVYHAKTWGPLDATLPAVMRFLSSNTDPLQLLAEIEASQSEAAARIARRLSGGLNNKKPDPLIAAGLSGALRTLEYLSLPSVSESFSRSDFSMSELGKGEQPTAIFLQFEEAKAQALGPLLAVMTSSLLTGLINTAQERRPVAVFLDEIGNFPAIPGLAEKLNTIRSRMMPTWLYFQSLEQIDRRYGRGAAPIVMASADVQMVFRLNDEPTRAQIAALVGTTEQHKVTVSKNDTGGSISRTRERVNVIEPHQLGELKPGQVVTLYRGAAALGRATPHFQDFPEFKRK